MEMARRGVNSPECPKCGKGSFDVLASKPVFTASGSESKCSNLIFECVYCKTISTWRRKWAAGKMKMVQV